MQTLRLNTGQKTFDTIVSWAHCFTHEKPIEHPSSSAANSNEKPGLLSRNHGHVFVRFGTSRRKTVVSDSKTVAPAPPPPPEVYGTGFYGGVLLGANVYQENRGQRSFTNDAGDTSTIDPRMTPVSLAAAQFVLIFSEPASSASHSKKQVCSTMDGQGGPFRGGGC